VRRLGAALALAAAQFATAADSRPAVDADLIGTRDTDGFVSTRERVGLLWSYESLYRFTGINVSADNYHQRGWSMHGASLLGIYRDVVRATGGGLSVVAGASRAGDATRLVGDLTWNRRLSDTTGFELIGSRAFVETRAALESAVMSNFAAATVDHAIGDRVTLVGLAGAQDFSDGNLRLHLRGRAFYLLSPEQGLSAEVRLRAYESSLRGPVSYFNPEHYARAELGLRLRRSMGDWRVFAELGGGRENVDPSIRNPTYYLGLQAQRAFESGMSLAINYTAQRSLESDAATSVQNRYRWQYLRAFFTVPF
jgi:hypothetical protein